MKIKIKINKKLYELDEAIDKDKGLKNVESIPDNGGMIFIYDNYGDRDFWMKDTLIPLLIIGVDEDFIITSVNLGQSKSEDHIKFKAKYVVELNANEEVKVGDEITFTDDLKNIGKMLVLDEKGKVQMRLDGGERIFSRKNTKIMVKFAARAFKTKKDNDYKALGKRVFKFLDIQDGNDKQYVELKN